MSSPFFASSVILFLLLSQTPGSRSRPNLCSGKCGNFTVPFPFHLNSSCSFSSAAFRLSCVNSSALHLTLGRKTYRVIEFFDDGVLVDFPVASASSATCRQYNDLNSFGFSGDEYFGLSVDNVVGLYDCEDSSLCKAGCETDELPGCDGGVSSGGSCCYPLSDHSAWRFGDGFSVFGRYGCRGFSSWVVSRGTDRGKRGVKLEWAVPRNSPEHICDWNAKIVNATAVKGGVRCLCQDGFVGDGFADGVGCLKYCYKDGQKAFGEGCFSKRRNVKKLVVLAGVLAPVLILSSLLALFCLLKQPVNPREFDSDLAGFQSTISFHKACRARIFTYRELEEATRGFQDTQKLAEGKNGAIYSGTLQDGSHVVIHKVHCENQREILDVSSQIEHLSEVSHRNLARILGCCFDYSYTPLVVYEFPINGTLEQHLRFRQIGNERSGLDWYRRLNIVTETAGLLGFLRYETYPPILHHNIKSCYIFLDEEFSARILGFGFASIGDHGSKNDVYDFGLLLLEIITGLNQQDSLSLPLQKLKNGKLEEIVDPFLYYHEQQGFFREQISNVADIATRCILFGGDGKLGMIDVARGLVQSIGGGGKKGTAIEETFSNSSLLQMISMSPDSIYLPKS